MLSDCLEDARVMGLDAGAVFLVSQEIVRWWRIGGLTDHFLEALARMKMGENVSARWSPDSPFCWSRIRKARWMVKDPCVGEVPLRSEGRVVGRCLFSRSYRILPAGCGSWWPSAT